MKKKSRILVTGAQGMGGSAVMWELERQGYSLVAGIDREECDLLSQREVFGFFSQWEPEYVFHVAARVGGVNANKTKGAEFAYENCLMQCNVFEASRISKVKKLLFVSSSCVYPSEVENPISEDKLFLGHPEDVSIGYSTAKLMGIVMCQQYRNQYGCNYISAIPTNLYGINDNFNLEESHVIPALIKKIHEAKENNKPTIEVWGTGKCRREFLYSDDFAEALVFLMQNYDSPEPVNIGRGKDMYIKDVVEIISHIIGYKGEILWNDKYPEGAVERRLDVSKINSLGWKDKTPFWIGVDKVYQWFLTNNYRT